MDTSSAAHTAHEPHTLTTQRPHTPGEQLVQRDLCELHPGSICAWNIHNGIWICVCEADSAQATAPPVRQVHEHGEMLHADDRASIEEWGHAG